MEKREASSDGEIATSFDDLPRELAVVILLVLPVKALIRSSTVCKTWYSLIKDPKFVSAQISRSISCCNENAVLIIPTDIENQKYCSLICAETGCVFDKYEIPFNTKTATLQLVGSVNGLLCFTDKYLRNFDNDPYPVIDFRYPFVYRSLYMWNPSIRKYKSMATSSFRKRYAYDMFRISYAVGFGFHQTSHDYRVVRIMYFNDKQGNQLITHRVEIFSLRMNKWRMINYTIVPQVTSEIGTTVNSSVYWLNTPSTKTYSEQVWLLSFDFNSEVFGQLKLPDDVRYSLGEAATFQLMKFEGSLCVCVRNRSTVINGIRSKPCFIWRLISHEDGIISSTIRFRVVLEKYGQPLNITKSGALIMGSLPEKSYGFINACILSCNLKSMHYKDLEFHKLTDYAQPADVDTFFIESFEGDELLNSGK